MAIKKTVLVRIAGQTHYSKHIEIDLSKLTNILKFPKDVFADVDGVRISIKREDFEQLIEENEKIN
jgi:aconitase A